MSKQRKNETKEGTNISSKLLGTSLADINIDKFREAWKNQNIALNLGGRCNLTLLKTITNKFSPDVIFTLTLSKQGLSNIDSLSECQNLMVLDLSANNIQSINALQTLVKLRLLNLSQNSISDLQPLSKAGELVSLQLQANLFNSVTQLAPLTTDINLKSIFLQSLSGALPNPVCGLVSYRQNVLEALPQLKRIDGVPVKIQDFSHQVKDIAQNDVKLEFKSLGAFYTAKFPTVPTYIPTPSTEEIALKKSMGGCKSAIQQLELKLKMIGL